MNVFILDEDWEVEVLCKALSARHPEDSFTLVDTLEDAVKTLWSKKFDVLVLDIMVPADDKAVPRSTELAGLISGLLLYDQLSKDTSCVNARTPFLFLTGLIANQHPKVKAAKEKYGTRFLHKPVHPETLYKHISEAIA